MTKINARRGETQEGRVVKNKVILNRGLYRWAAPRSVFVRGLVNYRFQDLQRLLLRLVVPLINNLRGRSHIKYGMTPLFDNGKCVEDAEQRPLSIRLCNKKAFTLIELLVVVLIIGILAAVALPQYQFAVAKSRFTEVVLLTYDLKKQQELFFLANGYYASNCEELDPELPARGYISDDGIHIHLAYDDQMLTCSNGGGQRVGMVAKDANLELWLDHIEKTPSTEKGFCRAKTNIGHKLCAQMGTIKEGKKTYNYYF